VSGGSGLPQNSLAPGQHVLARRDSVMSGYCAVAGHILDLPRLARPRHPLTALAQAVCTQLRRTQTKHLRRP
jgi:hypothetical protein